VIRYRIQPSRPEAHLFAVTLTIPAPTPEGQVLRMPAWIPGSYMIRDFARHVVSLRAECGGEPVAVAKLDKDSWQAAPCDGPLTVDIEVYGWDLSVRGAHLDTRHGYFNGTCVFLQPIGHEDQPCEVEILPPDGAAYATWRLATGMPRVSGGEWDFGRFRADNYDALIDYPVEMGHFEDARFEAGGIVHRIVISGHNGADLARLVRDLKPVCEYQIALFGGKPPMDDYLFMTLVTPDGYGGLEHRNSTSLMCARADLPRRSDAPDNLRDSYRTYLGLCSHEYFHSWMVKRIKPAAFTPYDLVQENYTELLWAFEGITSYYDDLALVRTGVITLESYLELLGQSISRVARGRGTSKQTVTESSFDAWTRFYKQDENASNAIVSYYAKGSLIALALDLTLRRLTDGSKTLDDLMRLLWQRHGAIGVGVPEQGIQALAEELAGQSLQAFFDLALYSTDPLPLAELLAEAGVELHWRAPLSHADQGGKPGNGASPLNLGVRVAEDALGARIQVAFEQGAAMAAGLSAGDVIIALNGMRTDARKLDDQLQQFVPGDEIEVHAFRRDELLRVKVRLDVGEASLAYLTVVSDGLSGFGRAWLGR
jgi:predicted metalloprotease with PDZ domain